LATGAHIEDSIGLRFPKRYAEAQDALHDFLEPQLRHHVAKNGHSTEKLGKSASFLDSVHAELRESSYEESNESTQRWDELHRTYEEMVSMTEPELLGHIADLHERLRQLGQALDRVQSSPSWLVTKHLKKVERLVSRVLP
jgi:hypothetical protein